MFFLSRVSSMTTYFTQSLANKLIFQKIKYFEKFYLTWQTATAVIGRSGNCRILRILSPTDDRTVIRRSCSRQSQRSRTEYLTPVLKQATNLDRFTNEKFILCCTSINNGKMLG